MLQVKLLSKCLKLSEKVVLRSGQTSEKVREFFFFRFVVGTLSKTNWLGPKSKKDRNKNCHKSLAKLQTFELKLANITALSVKKINITSRVTIVVLAKGHTVSAEGTCGHNNLIDSGHMKKPVPNHVWEILVSPVFKT